MKNRCLLIIMSLAFAFSLNGQIQILNETLVPISNADQIFVNNSFSNSQQETLEEALTNAFDSISAQSNTIGFNAAMLLPNGDIWKGASGIAVDDLATEQMTTEHLQGMGSITKSFVAATIMLMVEDEMLTLDDPIGDYLPDFPNIDSAITVRQILNHRSGLNDYLNENPATVVAWGENLDSIWTIETMLNNYVLEPNFEPEEDWSYSNTNYLLAGLLIESIEGQPWYEVVRNRIIDPLNLSHTFSHPFENYGTQPFAHAFSDIDGSGNMVDLEVNGLPMIGLFSMGSSAGNLITTPEDLVIFTNALFNGDLLLPESLAEMQTNYSPGVGIQYGLGIFGINLGGGLNSWGHNGSIIYQSIAQYVPQKGVSIAVQQNDPLVDNGQQQYVDHTDIFLGLLDAFCNYDATVDVLDVSTGDIFIYPNPNSGEFVIEMLGDSEIGQITDITGRVVMDLKLKVGVNQITLNDFLESGIYFVKVGGYVEKLVLRYN